MPDKGSIPSWLDPILSGSVTSFGGLGIALAIVLLVALRILLPAGTRKPIRVPFTLLLLHVLVILVRALVPEKSGADEWLSVAALFTSLATLGNAGFLLVIDWFVGVRLRKPMPRIFRDIIGVLVYVVVSIVTLRSAGVEPGSLLTTSALLTAVIALSLQETLGNLFAGLALEAQKPFAVGDWIQFDADPSHAGRVVEMNWRATKVVTNDGVEIIIPNGTLAKLPIFNYSQPSPVTRQRVFFGAPYDVPPARVQEVVGKAVSGLPDVLEDPAPQVLLKSYQDSSIEYMVLFHIRDFGARLRIESLVLSRVWYGMARAGIPFPFPVRDVRWRDASKDAEREAEERIAGREAGIRQVAFLAALSGPVVRQLAEHTEIRRFTAGETVIVQGDAGDELFIVRRGEVAVVVSRDGREAEVARLGPGKFFGEMSLMTGEARSATVRALEECELLVVGHAAFESILLAYPETAERVGKALAKRQAQLEARASLVPDAAGSAQSDRENALLSRIRSFFKL